MFLSSSAPTVQDILENTFGMIRCAAGNLRHPCIYDAARALRQLDESRRHGKSTWVAGGNCRGQLEQARNTVDYDIVTV